MRLDETDQRIIALLPRTPALRIADIGSSCRLSAPAVKRRVDRLRAGGVIKGFTAVVDPAAIGWTTEAFVELFCTGRTTPGPDRRGRQAPPGGGRRRTRSPARPTRWSTCAPPTSPHLEQALERLRAEPFVTSTRSMIVLSRAASTDGRPSARELDTV